MRSILLALALIAVVAVPSHAQGFTTPTPSLDAYMKSSAEKQELQTIVKRKKSGGKAGAKASKRKHAPAGATDFKRGEGRPAVDMFITSMNVEPAAQQQLRQVIDATFVAVEQKLRPNSVASGMAFALGSAMEIANNTEISDEYAMELVVGFNDLLAANAEFKRLKDPERQALYDAMIASGAMLFLMKMLAEQDPSMKAQLQTMAANLVTQLSGLK